MSRITKANQATMDRNTIAICNDLRKLVELSEERARAGSNLSAFPQGLFRERTSRLKFELEMEQILVSVACGAWFARQR